MTDPSSDQPEPKIENGNTHLEEPDELAPDGGLEGWIQVLGCFFLWFNSWGLTNAFGVFQTYYTSKFPDQTESNISLIGSIQPFLLIFIGFLAGPMWDAGYFRFLLWSGVFLSVLGYFMLSLCNAFWQVMLAQGIVVGLGSGFEFLISVAIVPQYFTRHRGFANGVAAAGSGLGGVIYPIALRQSLNHLSFGWSVRILAFIMLGTSIVPLIVLRTRNPPTSKRKLSFNLKDFIQDKPYGLYTLALFFTICAQYIPAFYIEDYVVSKRIMDPELAAYLLPIINAASIPGRTLPNLVSDVIGPVNVLLPSLAICSLLAFCWIAITSVAGCIIFCALYGFFVGVALSLPATCVISLSPDLSVVGARMGNAFALSSFGLLFGTPTGGAILKDTGFLGLQLFAGSLLAIATLGIFTARTAKVGFNFHRKV